MPHPPVEVRITQPFGSTQTLQYVTNEDRFCVSLNLRLDAAAVRGLMTPHDLAREIHDALLTTASEILQEIAGNYSKDKGYGRPSTDSMRRRMV